MDGTWERVLDELRRGCDEAEGRDWTVTVHAPSIEELDEAVAHVRATAASVLLDTQPATFRQLQGWTSTLPLATDSLGMRRVMDTDAIASAFPLASADLPAPLPGEAGGMLYGLNPDSNGIVWWDRWSQHNHNSVVLARSGAGKSLLHQVGGHPVPRGRRARRLHRPRRRIHPPRRRGRRSHHPARGIRGPAQPPGHPGRGPS